MNKEEFKVSIAKQFRQLNSPIQNLMLASNMRQTSASLTHRFCTHRDFYASEYGLSISVDVVEKDDGEPVFQIQFVELEEDAEITKVMARYDLSGNEFKTYRFTKETIDILGYLIYFGSTSFTLGSNEYEFFEQIDEVRHFTTYDISTGKFTDDNGQRVALEIYEAAEQARAKGTYNQYVHTPQCKSKLNGAMTVSHIGPSMQAEYQQLFGMGHYGANDVVMAIICSQLATLKRRTF